MQPERTEQEIVDPAVPDGSFPLPVLTLKRSGAVLNEAVAVIRNERARRHGQPGKVFTSDEMVTAACEVFFARSTCTTICKASTTSHPWVGRAMDNLQEGRFTLTCIRSPAVEIVPADMHANTADFTTFTTPSLTLQYFFSPGRLLEFFSVCFVPVERVEKISVRPRSPTRLNRCACA